MSLYEFFQQILFRIRKSIQQKPAQFPQRETESWMMMHHGKLKPDWNLRALYTFNQDEQTSLANSRAAADISNTEKVLSCTDRSEQKDRYRSQGFYCRNDQIALFVKCHIFVNTLFESGSDLRELSPCVATVDCRASCRTLNLWLCEVLRLVDSVLPWKTTLHRYTSSSTYPHARTRAESDTH